MSVKVAVRVRPFNTREKENNSVCCIEMTENQTTIKDELGQPKTFTFDHSFWSHDCYIELENGYLSPDDSGKYTDQKIVFETLGKQILDNAWEGYHCCLFAYGQTGSGKSYSMVGYGANKGIVPISCEEIFKRIGENKDPQIHYEVEVSMLEIYNEKVQDLLVPINKRPPTGLKIRESKALGVFVADLTKYPVSSYEEISNKMDEGYQNRTIGSTLMNSTSSRAHTIVTIEFKQVNTQGKLKSEKLSKINLVDLAGSERANSTGATGARLKEGCNINKSLLVLGNVINTLADKALGKKKDVLPPYRDSALTRILQNALGGNSKTVMICALSPASINYEETLSTLRYADRAKKIQNKAVVNESEHDKVVRLLREENNDLKKKIEELSKKLLGGTVQDEDKEAFKELKAQYDETQKLCESMSKTFSERLEEAKKADKELGIEKVDITKPHLIVLNEDPQLSHKLKYSLKELPIYVGRKHGNPEPKIKLSGIGIKQNHAIFISGEKENEIILKPNESDAIKYIYINGKKIKSQDGQKLKNKDRIVFGNNTILIYMEKSDGKDIYEIDWEMAQTELQNEIEEQNKIEEMENEKKKQQAYDILRTSLEQKYNKERQEIEENMNKQLKEYQDKMEEIKNKNEENKIEKEKNEQEMRRLKHQIEKLESEINEQKMKFQSEVVRSENEFKHKSELLENKLKNLMKKIYKFKGMLEDLKRNFELDLFLSKNLIDHYNDPNTPINIFIRVENYEEGNVYYWSQDIFHDRYDLLKELYNKFIEEDYDITKLSKENDPLYDIPKQSLLGYAFYKLEPLAYLMNNCISIPIISVTGDTEGTIVIDVVPINDKGELYEVIPENPMDLVGKSFKYYVHIKEVKDLPENFCKSFQVEYISFADNNNYKTKIYNEEGKENSFLIDEKFEHSINFLTEEDINFFLKDKICFKIYAIEQIEKKGKKGVPKKEEIIKNYEALKKIENKEKKEGLIKKAIAKGYIKKGSNNDKKNCVIF